MGAGTRLSGASYGLREDGGPLRKDGAGRRTGLCQRRGLAVTASIRLPGGRVLTGMRRIELLILGLAVVTALVLVTAGCGGGSGY